MNERSAKLFLRLRNLFIYKNFKKSTVENQSELTRDLQAKKRFLQEAQAAAALDHPNICTVHEISEVEGRMFIVMNYVKGQSLKERIALGPMKLEEALDISTQVGEGLSMTFLSFCAARR